MHQAAPIDVAPGWRARRAQRANALYRKVLTAITFLEGLGYTVTPPDEAHERLRDVSKHLRVTSIH